MTTWKAGNFMNSGKSKAQYQASLKPAPVAKPLPKAFAAQTTTNRLITAQKSQPIKGFQPLPKGFSGPAAPKQVVYNNALENYNKAKTNIQNAIHLQNQVQSVKSSKSFNTAQKLAKSRAEEQQAIQEANQRNTLSSRVNSVGSTIAHGIGKVAAFPSTADSYIQKKLGLSNYAKQTQAKGEYYNKAVTAGVKMAGNFPRQVAQMIPTVASSLKEGITGKKSEYTPKSEFTKTIFGTEKPIISVQTGVSSGARMAQDYAKTHGVNLSRGGAIAIGAGLAGGNILANLIPGGRGESKVLGDIIKASHEGETTALAHTLGVSHTPEFAAKVIAADTPEKAKALLNEVKAFSATPTTHAATTPVTQAPVAPHSIPNQAPSAPLPQNPPMRPRVPLAQSEVSQEYPQVANKLYSEVSDTGQEKVFANINDGGPQLSKVELGHYDENGNFVEAIAEDGRPMVDVVDENMNNLAKGAPRGTNRLAAASGSIPVGKALGETRRGFGSGKGRTKGLLGQKSGQQAIQDQLKEALPKMHNSKMDIVDIGEAKILAEKKSLTPEELQKAQSFLDQHHATGAKSRMAVEQEKSLIEQAKRADDFQAFKKTLPAMTPFSKAKELFLKAKNDLMRNPGSPSQIRTGISGIEAQRSNPLNYGAKSSIAKGPFGLQKTLPGFVKNPFVKSEVGKTKNMGAFRRFFTGGEKVLNRSGEGGKQMVKTMETQRKAEDLLRGRLNVHIDTALNNLSKEQLANVDKVLRGEAKPMDAATAGASKSLRNLLDSVGKTAQEMKFEVQNSKGIKTPFKMRENYAPQMYNFNELQKGKQRQAALDHLVKSGQARNLGEATQLLDRFIKKNAERRFGNLERAREIDLPTFTRDPKEYMKKYVQSIARRFTEAEHFGKKDEKIAELINKIAQDGGDYNSAQRIFDYTTKGAPQNKFVNAATQYNLATSLDLSAITNATQSLNTATKAGLLNTGKGMLASMTKKGREIAEMAGVDDDFIHSKETGVDLNKIVKFVMFPFKKVEKFNRIVSANAGVSRAQELAQKEMTDFTKNELKSLGIDPANIKNGKLSKEDMLSAAYEMTRKTQFKVDPLDVPTAWKTPIGKLATQFQSFSFMQTKFIRDEVLAQAKKGNFAPLVRFIPLAIGASYATNYVRNLVTGRDPNDANKSMDIRAWDKWGKAFGDFATSKIIQAKFLADTYNSPFNTPLKKVTRTLGSIGGPTVGKFGDVLNALEAVPNQQDKNKYLRKTGKEQDPYLEAKRFASGEIPFAGEAIKNKVFAYPKSTNSDERKQQNKDVYGLADELGKLPYGSKEARAKTQTYLESIPDQAERQRQAYILNQNGIDTKGISTSDDIIGGTPNYKKIQDLYDQGKDDEGDKQYQALSEDETKQYNAVRKAEMAKRTTKAKDLLNSDPKAAVQYVRSLREDQGDHIMEVLNQKGNEDLLAKYNSGKQQ